MSSVDYNMLISTLESTVVTEYIREDIPAYSYQSEADLEREFIKNLQNQGISLKIKIEAFNFIVQKSYSMEYGARELKRVIQKTLIDKITDLMLNGDIYNGSVITVGENKNDLIFDVENKY